MKDLIDEIIADEFASPDLELVWLDEDDADPKGLEAVLEGRLKLGAVTINEMRDALGLDPYTNPAADRAMVLTATGYVPIEADAGGHANAPIAIAVQKYSPNQPRVPAGNPDGGQWTSDGGGASPSGSTDGTDPSLATRTAQYAALDTGTSTDATNVGGTNGSAPASSSNNGLVIAGDIVTPRGFTIQRVPGQDPLDPQGLNAPISADEQQKIANALTLIDNGDVSTLNPHVYENYPHPVTGAVLPPSAQGYTAYDVRDSDTGRGVNRLLIDNGTGAIYYTNTHYYSFYPVQLHTRGE